MYRKDWRMLVAFLAGVLATLLLLQSYDRVAGKKFIKIDSYEIDTPAVIGAEAPSPIVGVCEICPVKSELKVEASKVVAVEEATPETSLGEFRITYYCCCEECCGQWAQYHRTSTGTIPTANHTVAVDPDIIPIGTTLIIFGQEYTAEDTGAFQGQTVDIYVDTHDEAFMLAAQRGDYAEVLIKEG